MRRSCNLLTREEMETGKVPTTPTTASVIAGIQVQEAVKYLHGKPTLAGKGFIFNGLDHDSYTVEYVRKEECYSHESFSPVTVLKQGVHEVTLAMLLAQARKMVGPDAVIEFNNDILRSLRCVKCDSEEELFMSLGKVAQKQGRCPKCGEMRDIQTLQSISGRESFLERTFGRSACRRLTSSQRVPERSRSSSNSEAMRRRCWVLSISKGRRHGRVQSPRKNRYRANQREILARRGLPRSLPGGGFPRLLRTGGAPPYPCSFPH